MPGNCRGNRPERAADLAGSIGFGVERLELAGPAVHDDQDDAAAATALLGLQDGGTFSHGQSDDTNSPCGEESPTGDGVA